jgi:hypothetical protein
MMNRLFWHVAGCATALMLCPTSSGAQTPAASFHELRAIVKDGDQVLLTDSNGRLTRGRLITIAPSSLGLMVEEPRFLFLTRRMPQTFSDSDVTTVARIDSRWNGALIGFAVGFRPGWPLPCDSGLYCELGTAFVAPALGVLGAVSGFVLDGTINQTVYRGTSPASGGATLSLSPVLTRRSTGALLNIEF